MGTTPIELATSNIEVCPLCNGRKFDDTMSNQRGGNDVPKCRVCKGRGVVYPNKVCMCGGAAVWYDNKSKLWTCGSTACLNAAKSRAAGTSMGAWVGT